MPDRSTIFALSSGRPPAAIAVVRISGPRAGVALQKLIGRVPAPRKAVLARVRDPASGEVIDEALALWFPAPHSETGEDVAELQLHGASVRCPHPKARHRTYSRASSATGKRRSISASRTTPPATVSPVGSPQRLHAVKAR